MSAAKFLSFMRELAIAIVPLFFSGFLFSELTESYKNDMTFRKDLVVDFYRPMRDVQSECRATEQQLISAYASTAGTYKLMLGELDHMAAADPVTMTRDYEVLPRSLIEANSKVLEEISELKPKLDACTQKLYRKYEEVALATSTYDQFIKIAGQRDTNVQSLYEQRVALVDQSTSQLAPELLMSTLRDAMALGDDTPEARSALKIKVHAVGDPVVEIYTKFSTNEAAIFKVEQNSDMEFIRLFAKEVSRRYKRGFFSAFWLS